MEKIALITDTGGDLSIQQLKENNIFLTPYRIIYKDKEYKDVLEISPREIYSRLEEELPMSSLPNLEDVDNLLTLLEEDGYTHVIIITISSNLSGTFNALRLACEDHPKLTSFVYDSKYLTVIQGLITLKVANLIKEGKSYLEILETLPRISKAAHGFFTIDTLEYLQRGGRIGSIAATLGSILNLKPIATINEEGILYSHSKVRGKKKALNKMTDLVKDVLKDHRCNLWVLQGGAIEESEKYFESLQGLENVNELKLQDLGPIFGMHAGPGIIALVYEKLD